MTQTEPLTRCATCGRPVRAADAVALGWTSSVGARGELLRSCPLCARLASRTASADGA